MLASWLAALGLFAAILQPATAQTQEVFNASGTWTAPDGVTEAFVEAWGGGGGGSNNPPNDAGGGGGGGAYANRTLPVIPGETYTVNVGAGGSAGQNGGNSSFIADAPADNVVAAGGSSSGNSATGGAGGQAGASSGDVTRSGGNGGAGATTGSPANRGGGGGGGSATAAANGGNGTNGGNNVAGSGGTGEGNGGNGGIGPNGGSNGQAPGGGGGGRGGQAASTASGSGASGRIVITYTPAATEIDHIRLEHSGIGLTCKPEPVTVRACADAGCTVLFTDEVTTTLQPSGWVGGDTITFDGGSIVAELRITTPGTVILGATDTDPPPQGTPATRCFIGATESCEMEFMEAGFVFDVPDHVADVEQIVTIAAVRTDDATQTCAPAFSGERSVGFWFDYENPASGTLAVHIENEPIGNTSPGTSIVLTFDETTAEAEFSLQYADVGQLQLHARHEGSGDETGLLMEGNSVFIVRPSHFTLAIPANPDPPAIDASGPIFAAAGEDFQVEVAARNASNEITPNFGLESGPGPESVDLEVTLVEPAGGNTPAVDGGFDPFGDDCAGDPAPGVACGNFNWPEVGIITLTPRLASGAYLGSADVVGNTTGNIGRFIPHHFAVTLNSPEFAAGCGSFTYIGQRFGYSTQPVLTAIARAKGETTTENYTGDFFKLTDDKLETDGEKTYQPANLDTNLIMTPDPVIDDLGDGTATLTFNSGTGFTFQRDAPVAPFDAGIHLTINVIDEDEVVYGDGDGVDLNPVRIPEAGGIDFDPDPEQRWGRLQIDSVSGSETEDLSVPVNAEYFNGVSFISNTADSCTSIAMADDIQLSNPETDGGAPKNGTETMTVGGGTSEITSPDPLVLVNGTAALVFSAPGDGNTGFIDIEITTTDAGSSLGHLSDWDEIEAQPANPRGRATFGVFLGPRSLIYIREPW